MELITGEQFIRLIGALVMVLALMGGLLLVLRRINTGAMISISSKISGQKRRLQVMEMTALDARRRLVLIRRDDREHLVILGPTGETVVETGIASIEKTDEPNANP